MLLRQINHGEPVPLDEAKDVLRHSDVDGSGQVDMNELEAAIAYWHATGAEREAEMIIAAEGYCCYCIPAKCLKKKIKYAGVGPDG